MSILQRVWQAAPMSITTVVAGPIVMATFAWLGFRDEGLFLMSGLAMVAIVGCVAILNIPPDVLPRDDK